MVPLLLLRGKPEVSDDLYLVSTKDLEAAIFRRYDAAVLIVAKDPVNGLEGHHTSFHGGRQRAVGLLILAKEDLLNRTPFTTRQQ